MYIMSDIGEGILMKVGYLNDLSEIYSGEGVHI